MGKHFNDNLMKSNLGVKRETRIPKRIKPKKEPENVNSDTGQNKDALTESLSFALRSHKE